MNSYDSGAIFAIQTQNIGKALGISLICDGDSRPSKITKNRWGNNVLRQHETSVKKTL